ncbi:MAG: 1-phosphofructokinase [Chloroflexi bacterium]|nr:1-phosphofructokinase [Chloroflexota bacterium]
MIATITLNPSLDEHITVHKLVVGGTNRWTQRHVYAGGKGIDVSRAVYEMGGTTMAYGFIGGAAGRTMEILLDEDGVPYSFTPVGRETRSNFIITDASTSQQTRIGAPGPRISQSELERFLNKIRKISPPPAFMVASGSVPPGLSAHIYYTLIAEAREHGIKTALDAEGQWLKKGIKARPYLVKPNIREAEGLFGRALPTEEDIIRAALDMLDMGIEIAAISRGKDGIIAASKERIVKAVSPPVGVLSDVGAGDSAVAGLVLKLADGESLAEACRLAVAMGSAAVMTPGTELGRRTDVEMLLPQVEVQEMTLKERARTTFVMSSKS